MLCIHNNSLLLNHIFAFTLPEIQDVPKKGTFPDFDVPFPVTGTGMTNSNPIFGNGNGNENSIKFHSLFREREWEWVRTLTRGGMYWKIHPPRPKRFPEGGDFAPRGPRDCPRAISRAKGCKIPA